MPLKVTEQTLYQIFNKVSSSNKMGPALALFTPRLGEWMKKQSESEWETKNGGFRDTAGWRMQYRRPRIWFALTLGLCLADFTVFGIMWLHRAGRDRGIQSEPEKRQTNRTQSADAVQIRHRRTTDVVRLTSKDRGVDEPTGRKTRQQENRGL